MNEKEQFKQMVDSIRYIFICDYFYQDNINYIKIEKGTIVVIKDVFRDMKINNPKSLSVSFLVGKITLHIPIDDFKFCTKSFDCREISVD